MTFTWPSNLFFLLVVPLLALLYVLAQRRRRKYALRYASLSLVREALGRGPGRRRHLPPVLAILAIGVLAFAASRPVTTITVPVEQGTVVLAIDVSGSMLADDLRPTRLDAAKAAARAFVQTQGPEVQIGVVTFSADAQLVQQPTIDHDLVLAAIDRLRPLTATAIGRGILTSLDALYDDPEIEAPSEGAYQRLAQGTEPKPGPFPGAGILNYPTTIVLLSDGQNNIAPMPIEILSEAITRGVRIYTVGVGTTQGTIVHIRGLSLREVLDEATLKQIAALTDAQYFNAATEKDLTAIYAHLRPTLVLRTQKLEVTALFAALAAALSLAAGGLSLLWFNRLP